MDATQNRWLGRARSQWTGGLAVPGILALTAEPLIWLWRSWWDPSYQSDGAIVALALLGLFAASLWSGAASPDPAARRHAWRLLLSTAAIRLIGRLLAVNSIGALALVLDVAAFGLLLGVARRPFALSPWGLAAFSMLALPVEHLAQRLLGHPLQLLASDLSHALLAPAYPQLERAGTLLVHPAVELAVDLPCSGARGLVLFGGLLLFALGPGQPTLLRLGGAALAALAGAVTANVLRIVALFVGALHGWPVDEQPWHELLGTAALMIGAAPLLVLLLGWPRRRPRWGVTRSAPRWGAQSWGMALPAWALPLAVSVLGLCVAAAPERPLDISRAAAPAPLPSHLAAFQGQPIALSELEEAYYARYGGQVSKRVYRDVAGMPFTALRVHTGSPLRHLHGPDRCLLGSGHQVTRLGVVVSPIPSVVYRSEAPDGTRWRVTASFVSDRGEWAHGVSEVVWRWLERPEVAWSLIERVTPWSSCENDPARCLAFDRDLFRALDLSAPAAAGQTRVAHAKPPEASSSGRPIPRSPDAHPTKESIHAARIISPHTAGP